MPPPAVEDEPVPSEVAPAPASPSVVPEAPAPSGPPVPAPAPVVEAPAPPPVAVAAEPLAGFSDGTAFLRAPDNSFILFPSGRLQVDSYVFHSANKVPNNTFLLRRARLELGGWIGGFVYFWLAGDFAQGPPAARGPGRARQHRHHRRLRRAGPLEEPGDPAGRPVRRPVHAREPHVGQVLRLHGAVDHRARVRHARQQRDRGDAARVQRRAELLLLARAGERRRAELQERRQPLRLDGAGLGGAVLVHRRGAAARRGDRGVVLDRRSGQHAGVAQSGDAGGLHVPQHGVLHRDDGWNDDARTSCGRSAA